MDSPTAESPNLESPTLLCIDDRAQVLALRKAALEQQGYSVKVATCSYAAIKTLEENEIAAVVLEYKQEGMDAEAVAYHIKHRFPRVPVILVSAYAEMPQRILWLVDEYVLKSELPHGLVRILRSQVQVARKATRSEERGMVSAMAA